jgi:hypothetical protein
MGCKGGNVLVSKVAWVKEGLDREMDAPYQCASGNPLNHFDAGGKSCKKFPWGKSCDTRLTSPNWNFYETVKASDERTIRTIMSLGQALYMRFDVYASFMKKLGITKYTLDLRGGRREAMQLVASATAYSMV